MQWNGERSGEYTATMPTVGAGQYEARIEATRGGRDDRHHCRARARVGGRRRVLRRHDARRRRCGALRKRRAADSTQRTPCRDSSEDLRYTGRGVTTVEERELWDLPIVFLHADRSAVRRVGLPQGSRALIGLRTAGAAGATGATGASVRRSRGSRRARDRRSPWCASRGVRAEVFGVSRPPHGADRRREDAVRWRCSPLPGCATDPTSGASRRGRTTIRAAERNFTRILKEITLVTPNLDKSNVVTQDDPDIFASPIVYVSEPGFWTMTDEELVEPAGVREEGRVPDLRRLPRRPLLQLRGTGAAPDSECASGGNRSSITTVFHSFFDIDIKETRGYYGPASFQGVFEDNDPTKRAAARGQLQPRSWRAVGVLGHRASFRSTSRTTPTSTASTTSSMR